MFSIKSVNEYYNTHIHKAIWNGLTDGEKELAIMRARLDVSNHIKQKKIDKTNVFQVCAVYEQTINTFKTNKLSKRALSFMNFK